MENFIKKKLSALESLQSIDSKLDEIKKIKGDLPQEVKDLEDEVEGYNTRIEKFKTDITQYEHEIKNKKESIKKHESYILRYEEQLRDVRNDREYEALEKEIETQKLDIELKNKGIKEIYEFIEEKNSIISEAIMRINQRKHDLKLKRKELKQITLENEIEEKKLNRKREIAANEMDDRLYESYMRIGKNSKGRLAVVTVKRSACGGCFNMVPPQRQADIKSRKKIIVCEHCGRIMTKVEDEILPEKPKGTSRRAIKTKELK